MTRLVSNLQVSLREAQEEYVRAVMRADSESNERQDLEKRNSELNNKLMEARQALKETQGALQSVQLATEHLTHKREQRESHIATLTQENNDHVSKIASLEAKLRDAEEAVVQSSSRRDLFVHELQDQLSQCQDEMYQAQAELTTISGEKMRVSDFCSIYGSWLCCWCCSTINMFLCVLLVTFTLQTELYLIVCWCYLLWCVLQVESELDSVRGKLEALEKKIKSNEATLDTTIKAKLSSLEERNKQLSEKVVGENSLQMKINNLEEQLKVKTKAAKVSSDAQKAADTSLHESQLRVRALEGKLHDCANLIQDLEFKLQASERSVEAERHTAVRVSLLEDELSQKEIALKALHQRNYELETAVAELEVRSTSVNAALSERTTALQELEFKFRSSERAKVSSAQTESRLIALEQELSEKKTSLLQIASSLKRAESHLEESESKCKSAEQLLHEKATRLQEVEFKLQTLEQQQAADKLALSRIDQLENELDDKKHKLSLEQSTTRSLQSQLEEGNARIMQLEESVHSKKGQMHDVELRLKHAELEAMSEKQKVSKIKVLEDQLAEKTSLLQVKTDKLKTAETTAMENAATIRSLETSVKEKSARLVELEHELQVAEKSLSTTRINGSSDNAKLVAMEKQYQELDQRMKEVAIEKHELQSKVELLEQLVENAAELALELDNIEEQASITRDELLVSQKKIKSLSSELDSVQEEVRAKDRQLATAQGQVRALSSQVSLGGGEGGIGVNGSQSTTEMEEASAKLAARREKKNRAQAPIMDIFAIKEEETPPVSRQSSAVENDGGVERERANILKRNSSKSLAKQSSRESIENGEGPDGAVILKRNSSKSLKRQSSTGSDGGGRTVEKKKSSRQLRPSKSTEEAVLSGDSDLEDNATAVNEETWSMLRNMAGTGQGITGNKHQTGRKSSLAVLVDFMGSTRREVEQLKDQKRKLKIEIAKWNEDFKAKNGRDATREEKETIAADLYIQYQKISTNLKKKENKLQKSEKTFRIKKEIMPGLREKEAK